MSEAGQPVIRLEEVVKSYDGGSTFAVDGVSFEVLPGEIFVLLAPREAARARFSE
ncbi:MAG TPA: hypothetical protein VHE55_03175 [Fimbriimonadaceae bacterium]|nr:hypothetical protein [Fimbriimonadaceae bacterium]